MTTQAEESPERADQPRQDALEMSLRLAQEGSDILNETSPPREDWERFCASFSEAHQGWIATLRSLDTDLLERDPERAQDEGHVVARGAALAAVRLREHDGARRVELELGEGPEAAAHVVENPVRVLVKRTNDGADAGLRIDGEDGTTALLRFRVPARTAELDGIAAGERRA